MIGGEKTPNIFFLPDILLFVKRDIVAATCDFQQCGILTSGDSYEPVQPPVKLRNFQMIFGE